MSFGNRAWYAVTLALCFLLGPMAARASYVFVGSGEDVQTYHYAIDRNRSMADESFDPWGNESPSPPMYQLSGKFDATVTHSWSSFKNSDGNGYWLAEIWFLEFSNVQLTGLPVSVRLPAMWKNDSALNFGTDGCNAFPIFPDSHQTCNSEFDPFTWRPEANLSSEFYFRGSVEAAGAPNGYLLTIVANQIPEPSTTALVCLASVALALRRTKKVSTYMF